MDRIRLRGLEVQALVGVYPRERDAPQRLRFDIDLHVDFAAAAASDSVADTVDYAAVAEAVRDFVAAQQVQLLESIAESVCAMLLSRFTVREVRLRIDKPDAARALGCAAVGVCIVRQRGLP